MSAEIRPIRTAAETALAANFAGATFDGASDLRGVAFRKFEAAGLPHRRIEAWKYTDLRALMRDAKPLAPPPDDAAKAEANGAGRTFDAVDLRRIVFVDGFLVPELSELDALDAGLTIGSLAAALRENEPPALTADERTDDVAVALNTAFMRDGALIRVAAGAALVRPLHLVFFNSGVGAVYARSVIEIERGARAMVLETHDGPPQSVSQINSVLEMTVAEEAHVDHIRVTGPGAGAINISTLLATVQRGARFNEFLFNGGGAVVRNQLFVRFEGEGIVAGVRGASMLRGAQHADTTLVTEHVAPGCISRQVFKAVVDDRARSIFQGKIVVESQAQQTDARMATHALLLSPDAEANSKPELEIFADDVQCGHGATVGALDDDLLFYLMARGIPAKEAEALMIQAFIGEAIEGIEHAGLRDTLSDQVGAWLKARGS